MRKLLLFAAVSGLICSSGREISAQQFAQGGNAPRFNIAVVDISFIFKNYPQFTQQIEGLKGEMEAADGKLKVDRDAIVAKEQERDALKPGSAEFKQRDEQLAQMKANFTIKQGTVRRDFLEREAKVYYQTYLEVSNAVRTYATQNSIAMVLRFNGDQIDPSQREDVMRAIMQPIVHQNNIDITPDVLLMLGVDVRKLPAQGPAAAAAPVANRPTAGVQR